MNEECTNTTADSHTPTTEQAAWMRDQLAEQFPDLSVSVELRGRTFYVEAVPA